MRRMKTLKIFLLVTSLGLCGPAMAQDGLVSLVKKVTARIDSMSVKGVDRRYIDISERPWQLILRGNVRQTIVSMKAQGDIGGNAYDANPYMKTTPSQYVGLWAGYRGYGLGYMVNVGGDKGSYLTFGATARAYRVNVRIHSFDNRNPNLNIDTDLIPEGDEDSWNKGQLTDPIHVNTVIADGYYLFNSKRFSYAAAYGRSVVQKRSAGSLVAGLMYNYTHIDYASSTNAAVIYLMQGLGRVKLWQGSVGAGYAYNWVPAQGLLVNVMAMPMLTFVNKIKAYGYATNMEELMSHENFWDPALSDAEWDAWFDSNARITPMGDKTFNSGLSVGFDARMSLTYNFGRYFLNAYGQFNNIRYRHNSTHGHVNDWFVNTSIGIRL